MSAFVRAAGGALLLGGCLSTASPRVGLPRAATRAGATSLTSAIGLHPQILAKTSGQYLPDFSYAGYREGEIPIPEPRATHAIADFGALPNDGQDDTAAFKKALNELARAPGSVALSLAKGRYDLRDTLFIERSDFVLRGAGSGEGGSVLAFQKPLADLPLAPVLADIAAYLVKNDKQVNGRPFSPFSWTGGLLWTRLPALAAAESPRGVRAIDGKRGQHALRIAGPAPALGLVELRWFNRFGNDSPVLQHLFGATGKIDGERLADAQAPLTTQILTLERIEGDVLWLKEPLRLDVRPEWGAELAPAPPRLTGVGLEHLRIEMPPEPYAGHHLERGANAIYLTDLRDSFVRDVAIVDSDSAILSDNCDHVTLASVGVSGRPGHYGIHLGDVDSVLVRDFEIKALREHSLSFNTGARGSVFSGGLVVAPRLDQHRGRNYQNLFDAISGTEEGNSSRLFEHGGADYWGPTHGAFNTFWNIALTFGNPHSIVQPLRVSGVSDAHQARLVGIHANVQLLLDYPGAYQEGINRADLALPSLYDEQLRERLAQRRALTLPSVPPPTTPYPLTPRP